MSEARLYQLGALSEFNKIVLLNKFGNSTIEYTQQNLWVAQCNGILKHDDGKAWRKGERKDNVSKCLLKILTKDKGGIHQVYGSYCVPSLEAEGRGSDAVSAVCMQAHTYMGRGTQRWGGWGPGERLHFHLRHRRLLCQHPESQSRVEVHINPHAEWLHLREQKVSRLRRAARSLPSFSKDGRRFVWSTWISSVGRVSPTITLCSEGARREEARPKHWWAQTSGHHPSSGLWGFQLLWPSPPKHYTQIHYPPPIKPHVCPVSVELCGVHGMLLYSDLFHFVFFLLQTHTTKHDHEALWAKPPPHGLCWTLGRVGESVCASLIEILVRVAKSQRAWAYHWEEHKRFQIKKNYSQVK